MINNTQQVNAELVSARGYDSGKATVSIITLYLLLI